MTPAFAAALREEAMIAWVLRFLADFDEEQLVRFLKGMTTPVQRAIFELWTWQAHGGQNEPAACATGEAWRVWVMMTGRGFGKNRAGSEWVAARAREIPGARIALIGASLDDVAQVMVEGESGLIETARTGERPTWYSTKRELHFPSGATAFAYSGEKPSRLRGPEHHFAWCDELAKWRYPEASWDMLRLGLRLGERPRTLVTTTPRPIAALKRILGEPRTAITYGRSSENVHLPEDHLEAVTALYAGSRLGRQELDGELFEDILGALWTRDLLEESRVDMGTVTFPHAGDDRGDGLGKSNCPLTRVVIGVDPPASADGDACGISVCGLGEDEVGYVLADLSAAGLSPEGWARRVAAAAEEWGADRVVAEANNGGAMVEAVLRGACVNLPVTLVHASQGKAARAEPVAALFESGRAKLAGAFPALEDELCGLTLGGRYQGPGRSPDRADAMVWALWALLIAPRRGTPSVRRL
jgi:phage terminase large subunit-like protein